MLEYLKLFFRILISMPKTIVFNFVTFNFKKAIFLPVYLDYRVKLISTYRGAISLEKVKPFIIKIGIGGTSAITGNRGAIVLNKKNSGKIEFKGNAKFSEGVSLCNISGITIFGDNFSCNKNCFIACDSKIEFGKDVLLGWDINIRDSDGHKIIYNDNQKIEEESSTYIGNHVWICSKVDILKNVCIGDNSIVGYKSLVVNLKADNNSLIVGHPAKIVRRNVNWKK